MKKFVFCFLLAFCSISIFAQHTKIVTDPDQKYLQARQDFYEQNYGTAYPIFQELKKTQTAAQINNNYLRSQEIDFYNIACGLMMREDGADITATNFLNGNENTVLKPQLNYYLGDYYFAKSDFPKAASAFGNSSVANLTNEQIATKNFEEGYAYFTQKDFAKAKPLLNSIRQIPTDKNYVDANYYYGFIAFSEKKYTEALQCFQLVESKGKFLNLVPFYITQIYYFQGQKDKALQKGEAALAAGNQYYDLELRQLVGHAYFEKGQFAKALPLLEKYVTNSEKVRREDLYELSYCYYDAKQLNKAIAGFKQLSSGQDTLSQNAMYLLGDSYLKTNQKSDARAAFLFCSTNSSNPKQKEISTFLYGKLSYELGFDNEALAALQTYNDQYHEGQFGAESRDLLVSVLTQTNNYKDALTLYESLPQVSENNKRIYPKILYNRAQELLNDGSLDAADKLLDKAEKSDYNTSLLPLVQFWRGEISYRNNQTNLATTELSSYLKNPITSGDANPSNANYVLGYLAMKNEDYKTALQYFQQVHNPTGGVGDDVQLRMADCYFMQKDFGRSSDLYSRTITNKGAAADYAIYQKGMIAGAQNRNADKVSVLKSLETMYPASTYVSDAQMEMANTYLAEENYKDALPVLNKIIANKNAEALKPQAYLKMGIAQTNLNKNDDALNTFKTLLNKYPQASESQDAVDNIRNIFIEQGRPGDYVQFLKSNGKNISNNEADSLTYASANIQLSNGDKVKALDGFKNYLTQFPDGRYAVEASYLTAQLLDEKKDKTSINYYNYVADKAPNKYAEKSLVIVARSQYFDDKDYAKAGTTYQKLKDYAANPDNKLEAMRGLIRCQYQLGQWADAQTNAQDLLNNKAAGSDDKIFAYMVTGKNAQSQNDCDNAIKAFKSAAALSKAQYGAEARYQIANCLYTQNKLPDAEKAAMDVVKKASSYEEWVTKSYILLGDIYLKEKDYFNAKATYKSVAENAHLDDLKKQAADKFKIAEDEENKNGKVVKN